VGHQLSPGRERRACCGYLKQGHGLSPLPSGEDNDAQLFAQTRTLRIRLNRGLDYSTVGSISPLRAVAILPPSHFHRFSRAGGPKGLNRVYPTCTERPSLNKECGWKGGDRSGLAHGQELTGRKRRTKTSLQERKKRKNILDTHRPSHGSTSDSFGVFIGRQNAR